jgi:hypothetical protein
VLRLAPWLAALVCALVLAGCGGDEGSAPPALPPAVAADLATKSESIADLLDAGNTCGAARQADVLVRAVETAITSGRVPVAFRASLRKTATELQNEVNCPPPREPAPSDCDALEEQKAALEEERDQATGEGKRRKLEEQIAELEQQIDACKAAQGEEGDD